MAPRALAALRAVSARRRAAAAAAAASAPCGLEPVDDDSSSSSAAVHNLTCLTPNVANLSASGAHVAPNTCGGVPANPTATVSTHGVGRPGCPPPQPHTRTVCLESDATVTILAAPPPPGACGSPVPGPKAIATTARSPGSWRSRATSFPVAISQMHAQGARPLRCPVAAHLPAACVVRLVISSSCPRKKRCRHALASNTTPIAPHAYTHTTPLYPPGFIHSSMDSLDVSASSAFRAGSSVQVLGAAASMPHLPATEHPYAHSAARSSFGASALRLA